MSNPSSAREPVGVVCSNGVRNLDFFPVVRILLGETTTEGMKAPVDDLPVEDRPEGRRRSWFAIRDDVFVDLLRGGHIVYYLVRAPAQQVE